MANFQRGCDKESSFACKTLGDLHIQGLGVKQSGTTAASFYEKACKVFDDFWLADMKYLGLGGVGCYSLAKAYEHGRGVTKDTSRANKLYEKACKHGDNKACKVVDELEK